MVLGGCGTGRTTALHALVDRLGRDDCQYIDVERAASTPERFFARADGGLAVSAAAPAASAAHRRARRSTTRSRISRARAPATGPATFLLDEVLELRTFESFPGSAARAARAAAGARRERQPLRADVALRGARASAAARRDRRASKSSTCRRCRRPRSPGMLPPMGDAASDDRDFLSRTIQALSDGRAALRPRHQRSHGGGQRSRRRSDFGAHRAAHLRRRAHRVVRLSLRAAPAPRARLRRAQGDSGDPRRRGAADAHRDRAAPAAHARLDQGLSLLARGRRPRRLAAEALQLRRSAAAAVGAPALPAGAAQRRRSRARGAELRARAAAAAANRRSRWLAPAQRTQALGHHRDRLSSRGRGRSEQCSRGVRTRSPSAFHIRDLRHRTPPSRVDASSQRAPSPRPARHPSSSARCPGRSTSPPTSTST